MWPLSGTHGTTLGTLSFHVPEIKHLGDFTVNLVHVVSQFETEQNKEFT